MFAKRLDGITTSGIRKMFEMAGKDTIHLGLGEPDFPPPPVAIEAMKRAVDQGYNKYTSIFGIDPLREEISKYLKKYRPDITKDDILITVGGSEALMCAAGALYEVGDEVLIPDPGFVLYRPHVIIMGGKPVPYSLKLENEYLPYQDEIMNKITERTKAIVVNSPSNPTGAVFGEKDVNMIIDIAKENDLVIISDEVYDQIIYEGDHVSFLGKYDKVVYVNSFSKTFAMPGWRIGYTTARQDILERMTMWHYHTLACAPGPNQMGVLSAMKDGTAYTMKMVDEFRVRRDLIVDLLNEIPGFNANIPKGAFYSMPSYEKKMDDKELAIKMLEAGVVCSPGSAFGQMGSNHIRFSYANSQDNIKKGLERVKGAYSNI